MEIDENRAFNLKELLKERSWAAYSDMEKVAWLYIFILNKDVNVMVENVYALDDDVLIQEMDANLIALCEEKIKGSNFEKRYYENCTTDIAVYAHRKNTNPESLTREFYAAAIKYPIDRRATAMFWSYHGMSM